MGQFKFATIRLGKTSVEDIKIINAKPTGIQSSTFRVDVVSTQVPSECEPGCYVFIWLGSDNNKGQATEWKQGFKAFGKVIELKRGAQWSDETTTSVEVSYIFQNAITRLDLLTDTPDEYYWCSAAPIIGLDDHSNQTVRMFANGPERCEPNAFFCALEMINHGFKDDMVSLDASFASLFDFDKPSPKKHRGTAGQCEAKQRIYFGTPGSGKSYKVKEIVSGNAEFTFRTTFHPDTDYASFVGSYKPVVGHNVMSTTTELTINELATILKESCETAVSKVAAINTFGIEYADYFNGKIADFSKKELLGLAGLPDTYDGDLSAMNNLRNELVTKGIIHTDAAISYEFVPQAFTNAYVAAWQNPGQKVYLVIEEINRGNCAQIFGDLFQLLDRDGSGLSEYPIKADTDLKNYLEDIDVLGPDHEGIRNGELRLPSNLHILATMNTSDQSLFPMDSAFKRRWDWEYVPSDPGCEESQFEITIGESKYSWAAFMVEANKRILKLSESEDKQMGNFFIKKNLSEDEFKSKVMFYLWSEICKDFYKSGSFFKNANSGDEEFTFNQLYPKNEKTTGMLQGFMKHLGISEL